jgi:hypothetical protein
MRHFTFLIGDLWPNCPLPDDLARALLTADEALALVSKTEVSIPDGVERTSSRTSMISQSPTVSRLLSSERKLTILPSALCR